MSRPFDRGSDLAPAGDLDVEGGQVWVGNPWRIHENEFNLSAYEKNATGINLGNAEFANISFVSGTDSDGDGRSAIAADLDNDGRLELIVRQAGGGPLLIYRNRFPQRNWLRVSLRGTRSNGRGIGARLEARIGSRTLVRELYPLNSYSSHAPSEVHFGLDDAAQVDSLTIRWPSGAVQELSDVAINRHLKVTEPAD